MPPYKFRTLYRAFMRSRLVAVLILLLRRATGEPAIRPRHQALPVPGLPPDADGLRILHVSDLHLCADGPGIEQIAVAARSLGPVDLVVHTGDFIDTDDDIDRVAELLAVLPRGRLGDFAVLGNHDHIAYLREEPNDVQRLVKALDTAGVTVLRNDCAPLSDHGIHLVGVDDPFTGRADPARAYRDVPVGAPNLLLAHTPDIAYTLDGHRPAAVLAGHTHGGQICLPLLGAVVRVSRLPRRRQRGVQYLAGTVLHISPGVGYSGPRLRLGVPPEITCLTLVAADQGRVAATRPAVAYRGAVRAARP